MSTTTAAGLRSSFEASLDLALAITILKSKPPNLSAREYVRAVLACDPTIVPTEPSAPAKDAPRHGSGVGPVSEKEVSVQEERASDQKGKSRRRDDCGHVDESREKERHEASEQLIRDLREELSGVKRKLCETELELDGLKAKDGQTGKKHKKEKRASRSKAATAARHVANSMNDPANAKLLKDSMEFLESVKLLADAVFRKEDEDPAPDSSKTTQIHTVSSLSNKRTEHGEAILSAASKVVKILLDQLEIHTTQIVPKQSQTREHRKPQPFALFMAILGNKPAWHITENSLRHFMKLLKEILGRVTAFTTSPLLNTSEQRSLRLVLSTTVRRILDSITLMTYRIDEMFAMCPDDIHAPLSNSDQTNDPPSVDELPVWWEDDGEDPSEQIKDLAVTLCEQRIEITAAAMCHLLRRVCATAEFLVGEGTANAVELGGKDSDAGADSTGRSATTTSPASFLVDCSTRSRMTGVVYRHLDILEELLNLYERQLAVVQWNANLASKDQDDSLRDVNLGWLHDDMSVKSSCLLDLCLPCLSSSPWTNCFDSGISTDTENEHQPPPTPPPEPIQPVSSNARSTEQLHHRRRRKMPPEITTYVTRLVVRMRHILAMNLPADLKAWYSECYARDGVYGKRTVGLEKSMMSVLDRGPFERLVRRPMASPYSGV